MPLRHDHRVCERCNHRAAKLEVFGKWFCSDCLTIAFRSKDVERAISIAHFDRLVVDHLTAIRFLINRGVEAYTEKTTKEEPENVSRTVRVVGELKKRYMETEAPADGCYISYSSNAGGEWLPKGEYCLVLNQRDGFSEGRWQTPVRIGYIKEVTSKRWHLQVFELPNVTFEVPTISLAKRVAWAHCRQNKNQMPAPLGLVD